MKKMRLGRTNIEASRVAFGALPIQRVNDCEAVNILRAARDAGVNYFDTARAYSDSEHKLGLAFGGKARGEIYIATKSTAKKADAFNADLDRSLRELKTDYVDVIQFHNPPFVPAPGGEDGLYDAAKAAIAAGKARFLGITQHSINGAFEAARSGLYDTLQFPFNHIAGEAERELVKLCNERDVGFVAMKALSGGLITDAEAAFAYLWSCDGVLPIWGIQRLCELEQFVALEKNPPTLDAAMLDRIQADRAELSGSFCRSCGYCMPCPQGIQINNANRMIQLLTRMPENSWLTEEWRANMEMITTCTRCGQCEKRCPYHLKPYDTLPAHLEYYRKTWAEKHGADSPS